MISIVFKNQSDSRLAVSLQAKGPHMVEVVSAEMNRLMYDLLRRIQEKLSGEVLQPRKGGGGLLGTARVAPVEVTGAKIKDSVTVGGGVASAYAAVQEYGGRRQYDIYPRNKKALAFFPAGSAAAAVGGSILSRFEGGGGAAYTGATVVSGPSYFQGLKLRFKQGARRGQLRPEKFGAFKGLGGIVVKHVVHPPLPERSYARSARDEMLGEIVSRLRQKLVEGLR